MRDVIIDSDQPEDLVMKLFYLLVCSLTMTLVAQAADQGNNNPKKNHAKQGHPQPRQQQAGKQGSHNGTNTALQQNNRSQFKHQGQPHGLKVQNNNVRAAQSRSKGQARTKQHGAITAQNNNVRAVHSNNKGKVRNTHNGAKTALRQDNPAHLENQSQPKGLNAQNKNGRAVQASGNGKARTKHFQLANAPNPRIASTSFTQNYRIQGSENWQGQRYGAFQNYRDEWHDRGWWHNHYNRIVLISGGWYFWNANYWYPAWGYDSAVSYYPYNGPIYAYNNLPPDQVIANVQSTLQAQGYYEGEVDGMLGPITREALANYQRDHSLYMTEAIDEPTLESLGMS